MPFARRGRRCWPCSCCSGDPSWLGVLTAADRRLSPAVVTGLAVTLGLLHGWLNGSGIATAGREALGLAGIVAAIFVLVAMVAAFVVSLVRAARGGATG